jgi:hypothetical protein
MNHEEKRKYIEELFKYVDTESILVIKEWNTLERFRCPFVVKARRDVGLCKVGNYYTVEAVKVDSRTLQDVYIIQGKAYRIKNFLVFYQI